MRDTLQIWYNDELLDLFPNTVFAQTFRSFDFTSFNTQFRSYTNNFSLPGTDNNNRIFGNINIEQSDDDTIYTQNSCRVIQNGVEVVNGGLAVVTGSRRGYTMYVISGLSFFDTIGSEKLTDLDFTTATGNGYNGSSNPIYTATTGRINPVMNYGRFDGADLLEEIYIPSFFYHSLIDSIVSDAGLTKSGTIFSDNKYLNTIIPFSRNKYAYAKDFIDRRLVIVEKNSGQSISNANLPTTNITFPDVIYEGAEGWWNNATSDYTPVEADASTGERICYIQVELTLDVTVTGGTVDIIVQNSSFPALATGIGTSSFTAITGANVASALVNTSYNIRASSASGTPSVTVNSGRLTITPINEPPYGSNSHMYYNLLLPDMSKKDFLKDFSIRFGQFFKEVDRVLYCKSIDEIISDKANAVDWTTKRVRDSDEYSYVPSGYAKNNYLRYNAIDFQVPEDFGQALFTISNQGLQDEKTLYSKFSSSKTDYTGDIYCAHVPVYDGTEASFMENFKLNPGLRVLMVRDKSTDEPTLTANGGAITGISSYKVAYFHDRNQTYTCKYDESLDSYYPLYIGALQNYKLVTREYNLTEADIQNLDFFLPIFDRDSYYVLSEVGPYIPNKPCKVKMLKV